MTLKNNRAPLLCCFQLCAWFHCYMWIQTGVRVRKRLSWVLTSVTLTFDLWPWPFAWTSFLSMVIIPENFMMIRWWEHGENIVNKANLRDLIAATGRVILLKLDLNRRFFSPCDLEIWWMTPKNNRAPLLCYFKLFASFRSHWWIQTGVTVRKRLIWVNIDAFLSRVTLKFDGWPSKTIDWLNIFILSFLTKYRTHIFLALTHQCFHCPCMHIAQPCILLESIPIFPGPISFCDLWDSRTFHLPQ